MRTGMKPTVTSVSSVAGSVLEDPDSDAVAVGALLAVVAVGSASSSPPQAATNVASSDTSRSAETARISGFIRIVDPSHDGCSSLSEVRPTWHTGSQVYQWRRRL